MSSTYSDNLKIELIGTGDQAGNWGSTTNTNLGTLIEQAISGYVTQSMPGTDVTLTMTNGASATARNMFIEMTGTGGASLLVPTNKKLYFIYNNTSNATTVKVSGQTGVSVPATAKIALVCNGTDIVTATNYMTGATFPSPTLTGTPIAPTASAGTNTTQIATTAFVTAALAAAYPVGAIYTSTVSTSPATLLGFGSWSRFGQGRVLLSADDSTYIAGAVGGSATTTLAEANLPSHTHSISTNTTGITISQNAEQYNTGHQLAGGGSFTVYPTPATITLNDPGHTHTIGNTGSGTSFTNLPPYVVVYMWTRTA